MVKLPQFDLTNEYLSMILTSSILTRNTMHEKAINFKYALQINFAAAPEIEIEILK